MIIQEIIMNTKSLVLSTIALTLFGGAIAPEKAKAGISMNIVVDEGEWYLGVPDADTTISAYGGKLRLYDVHIAKMIEVTHDSCTRGRYTRPHPWTYTADRGKAKMGSFIISCTLANDLVTAYGLGKPEATAFEGDIKRRRCCMNRFIAMSFPMS
jgi:hypothetical protein